MIKYALICGLDHEFEGWFRDSRDFDQQSAADLIDCPVCGSCDVRKAIMAPAVARSGALNISTAKAEKLAAVKTEMSKAAEKARDYVEKNFDYVGDKFAEEARKIHYGETEQRDIYGEATAKDVRDLKDEGVPVAPVPADKSPASPDKKKLN